MKHGPKYVYGGGEDTHHLNVTNPPPKKKQQSRYKRTISRYFLPPTIYIT